MIILAPILPFSQQLLLTTDVLSSSVLNLDNLNSHRVPRRSSLDPEAGHHQKPASTLQIITCNTERRSYDEKHHQTVNCCFDYRSFD
jgi:hypothetical protein